MNSLQVHSKLWYPSPNLSQMFISGEVKNAKHSLRIIYKLSLISSLCIVFAILRQKHSVYIEIGISEK